MRSRLRLAVYAGLVAVVAAAVGLLGACGSTTHSARSHTAAFVPATGPVVHGQRFTSRLYSARALRYGVPRGQLAGGRLHEEAGFGATVPGTPTGSIPRTGSVSVLRGYDAVTAGFIPLHASFAGCYGNGRFANCSAVAARGPGHLVPISVYYTISIGAQQCLDVEPGDAVPSQAAPFVRYEHAHGVKTPCVYGDLSEWQTGIRADLTAAGLHDATGGYHSWVAWYNGDPAIPPSYDGHQFLTGCCVDVNSFYSSWWAQPKPPPAPAPQNYVWFLHPAPAAGLTGSAVPVSYQGRTYQAVERTLVQQYDVARGKPQSGTRLKYEARIRYELHALARHLNALSQHRSTKLNTAWHDFGRVDGDLDRALGNVVKSWSGAVAWGKSHNTARWL